jgi:transcriptional regulator with PAS, ATPase and Fis domain
LLEGFDWRGNVRQLRNVLESIIIMSSREVIDVADLPENLRSGTPHPSLSSLVRPGLTLDEIQRQAIRLALERCGGSRTRAAKELGISERTLYRRIEEYGLG